MKSIHCILSALLLAPTAVLAQSPAPVTVHKGAPAASGSVITMADIATMPEMGVADLGDGIYSMSKSLKILEDAAFSIEGVAILKMGDGVVLDICGAAFFDATNGGSLPGQRILITRAGDDAKPCGIRIYNDSCEPAEFRNIDFEYVQLANSGAVGFDVADCTFTKATNALNNTAAVSVAIDDAVFHISGCTFTECEVPAVGCPANQAVDLTITDCTFIDNNTSNTNKPQLNLTVGSDHDLTIRNCTLTGTGRNKVGGIAVGNLTMLSGANRVYIEGCNISGHRYGITGVGPMYMEIRDNVLVDNCHETNAMNGGSGISLAGYGYGLDAIISGNRIERSLWGVTLIQCRDVNLGQVGNPASPGGNVFVDNGNGGVPYDLYNNQSADVYAQLNTWSVAEQTADEIEKVIFHHNDNSSLGEVTYMPASDLSGIPSASLQRGINVDGNTITSSAPVTLFRADGTLAAKASTHVDMSGMAPGVYIATDGRYTVKIKK